MNTTTKYFYIASPPISISIKAAALAMVGLTVQVSKNSFWVTEPDFNGEAKYIRVPADQVNAEFVPEFFDLLKFEKDANRNLPNILDFDDEWLNFECPNEYKLQKRPEDNKTVSEEESTVIPAYPPHKGSVKDFLILSAHTNHTREIIFGGCLAAEMDSSAAMAVRRLYEEREKELEAVTHKMDIEFKMPSYVGDTLTIEAKVVDTKQKALEVEVKVMRGKDRIADGHFVFIATKPLTNEVVSEHPRLLPYTAHEIEME